METTKSDGRQALLEAAGGALRSTVDVDGRLVDVRTDLDAIDPQGALRGTPDEMDPEYVAAVREALLALHDLARHCAEQMIEQPDLGEYDLSTEGVLGLARAARDAHRCESGEITGERCGARAVERVDVVRPDVRASHKAAGYDGIRSHWTAASGVLRLRVCSGCYDDLLESEGAWAHAGGWAWGSESTEAPAIRLAESRQ